jgi:hypothetical protein
MGVLAMVGKLDAVAAALAAALAFQATLEDLAALDVEAVEPRHEPAVQEVRQPPLPRWRHVIGFHISGAPAEKRGPGTTRLRGWHAHGAVAVGMISPYAGSMPTQTAAWACHPAEAARPHRIVNA